MNGILLIDKPEGLSSAEVVRRVSRRVSVKVGHLGTLDPFATGVLPLCLGEATKVAQFLSAADKSYDGVIALGSATDTGDRTGRVVRTAPIPPIESSQLEALASEMIGEHAQVPPMYSAVKREGVPLYKLARRGIEVERQARTIRISALRLALAETDRLRFELSCSKGTYVRVLAEEIAARLGTAGHLEALRRTRFGKFGLESAIPLEEWETRWEEGFVGIARALEHLPQVELDDEEAGAAGQGKVALLGKLARSGRLRSSSGSTVVLIRPGGAAVAVVEYESGRWGFARVLSEVAALQPPEPMLARRTNKKMEKRWG